VFDRSGLGTIPAFVDATLLSLYKGHRFPVEIISYCVLLCHRFPLSLRDVEQMTVQRGVSVSYDTIYQWCHKFGQTYANDLRRRRPRPRE
jgi:putative transposase